MSTTRLLTLVLTVTPVATAIAQRSQGDAAILHGPRHAFSVSAPPGWILDTRAGSGDQVPAVVYPQGQSWQDAVAVMYVNTVLPDEGKSANVADVIAADSVRFRTERAGVTITRSGTIPIANGTQVPLLRFVGGGNYEAVAYVQQHTVTPILVLTARSQAAFNEALPAFRLFVKSYRFITDSVVVRH